MLFACALRLILAENKMEALRSLPDHMRSWHNQRSIIGSPSECAERLQEYVDIGVDLIILRLHNTAQTDRQIQVIRDEIIPSIG